MIPMFNGLFKYDRCDKCFDKAAFVSKTGKPTKTCNECRQKILKTYHAMKSNDNPLYNLNPIEPNEMKKKLLESILESHELGKTIAEIVGSADGYYYIYHMVYKSEKNPHQYTFWYNCSQSCTLAKRPRKHKDLDKQRDREYIE
ncbi:15218_t:CDS:2 [Cetraspora pellucida]|uniref:15218_t:CDS:1 n=1 Tax=Cetraspora pellucida TaxID=1433469 RepID=A0A9N9JZF5_9GLOM|nr:15218_t:CDS:2 [Cetraspora pellucida]